MKQSDLNLVMLGILIPLGCLLPGCQTTQPVKQTAELPSAHSVRTDQLLVLSNFRLQKDHELIRDLEQLRKQVAQTLKLPMYGEQVVIYLFENELIYRQYLAVTHPNLPPRRAYFVGTPQELAVYTYWGKRIQEDLRHEFTHGLLHSVLRNVPLWLDEGLAEYFEVPGQEVGTLNTNTVEKLQHVIKNGWKPDIERLESLEEFSEMQRLDYQEAWGWVHFMLHSSEATRHELLSYLDELQTKQNPEVLSSRLKNVLPAFQERYLAYLTNGLIPGTISLQEDFTVGVE